ncbi:hypothetical protein BT63DRAFT_419259 [Microthyrium microscopicum]|uniref:Synaptobrevin n=1 Tax=Microthyrium microscopicum TaxID=703497 RepID=A0A6A6TX16_9PEZI|nr:hypothetical protein BT63DRAFT_419259 [Microthyrium microscopicum]
MPPILAFERPGSDQALKNLTKLLSHLDRTLSSPDTETLLKSPYERQKFKTNFEHARALLLRLEHESAGIKIASRKQAIQTDLRSKRDLTKKLQSRIQELDAIPPESDSDDSESESEQSSPPPSYAPAYNTNPIPPAASEQPQSTLRHRGRPATPDPADRDAKLSTDRNEQDAITASLLALTRELKSSASSFHGSILSEKKILERAAQGLEKNTDGMESAGEKMSTLRRMTEGKGWLGRMKLYAIVGVLWVAAFLLVFVGPKIRF